MVNKWRILSTAPLPPPLLALAEKNGAELDVLPFTKIDAVKDAQLQKEISLLLAQKLTVVFTSANAVGPVVNSLSSPLPNWDIYCISNATGEKVNERFEGLIKKTADNAHALAEAIAKDNIKDVVFFCGNNRLDVLPAYLKQSGIKVKEVVVYTSEETPHKISKEYNAILFFSPSGVKSFFSCNKINNDTVLFAIGNTTAEAIKQYSNNKTITAATPSKENVLMLALKHLETEAV